jgi:transposase
MRKARVFGQLLGVQGMVIGDVTIEADRDGDGEILVVSVRPDARSAGRCAQCRRSCPGYDPGVGTRRWRTVDTGTTRTFLEAAAPRVKCPVHGVLVAHVPWARPGAKCTYLLEDTCAWLAKNMALAAVTVFLRLSWRTVAAIVARVVQDLTGKTDQLDGLTRIGIDEISYRKGHRFLTCVVDHDTGRLVWAHEGRNKDTLTLFFDALGTTRSALLTHVSADGAEWIHSVVRQKAPKAAICLDPFHIVMWCTKALDKVRRRTLEAAGGRDRNARWAVIKNPGDLTDDQQLSLARIKTTNSGLYRAYLLKEQLRAVFATKGRRGEELLAGWIAWARRSRLPEFVKLARTMKHFQQLIWNTLKHGLSNARSEATNTHIRALTKRAYGYHSPEALIAMAMLTRGGLKLELPGRNH